MLIRRGLFILIGLTALVVIGVMAAPAEPAQAQLAPRDQVDADVLYMTNRNEYLLVWSEDRGAGHVIYGKRIRFNGLPVGGPSGGEWEITGVADPGGTKGDQRWPAITNGLLVWSELVPGGTDYDLYAQRLLSNSKSNGRPRLIAGGPGDQKFADVVQSRSSEFLVVWSDDVTDAGDVKGIRVSTALTLRSSVIEIAKGPETAEDPTIAQDTSGSNLMIVLWTDDRNGNKDIYGTRVASTGLPRGGGATFGHFPVIEAPEDDYAPVLLTAVEESGPTIRPPVSDPATRNLMMWTRDTVTDGPDVLALRYRSNGYGVGSELTIAGGPGIQAWSAGALKTRRGQRSEWLTVWEADPLGTRDIMGVELNLNGHIRRPERILAAD